jgi:pimeloyl-ACP methyl ester carboxylesterase
MTSPLSFPFHLLFINSTSIYSSYPLHRQKKMAEKAKPTIVFVPGIWEGPTVFTSLSTTLQALGYPTETATLPSTGTSSPGNPSMRDDEQAIRYIVKRLVIDEEKTVILVCHSAGGFLASGAIEGLSAKNLEKKGGKGGVAKFVFLTAGLAAEGYVHGKMPFMDFVVSSFFVWVRRSKEVLNEGLEGKRRDALCHSGVDAVQ